MAVCLSYCAPFRPLRPSNSGLLTVPRTQKTSATRSLNCGTHHCCISDHAENTFLLLDQETPLPLNGFAVLIYAHLCDRYLILCCWPDPLIFFSVCCLCPWFYNTLLLHALLFKTFITTVFITLCVLYGCLSCLLLISLCSTLSVFISEMYYLC